MKMNLTSTVFQNGETMPRKYTADGENVSPPLAWSLPPAHTKSLALILDDPDAPAGTWVHWVVYGVSPQLSELKENLPAQRILANGIRQGFNSFHRIGYGGPSPPPGKPHRYIFKLYALDTELNLEPGLSAKQVEQAMTGHTLATVQLMAQYGR